MHENELGNLALDGMKAYRAARSATMVGDDGAVHDTSGTRSSPASASSDACGASKRGVGRKPATSDRPRALLAASV